MVRRHWLLVVLVVVGVGVGRVLLFPLQSHGATRKLVPANLEALEAEVGYPLYTPTWLPDGLQASDLGASRGKYRVVIGYVDPRRCPMLIMAQEPRTRERDAYNADLFIQPAEARTDVNGKPAYLVTGRTGERRLFWQEERVSIILSSPHLSDRDLLEIARRMR